jgi:hypothetical protein
VVPRAERALELVGELGRLSSVTALALGFKG